MTSVKKKEKFNNKDDRCKNINGLLAPPGGLDLQPLSLTNLFNNSFLLKIFTHMARISL